jgi:hypothetical protein
LSNDIKKLAQIGPAFITCISKNYFLPAAAAIKSNKIAGMIKFEPEEEAASSAITTGASITAGAGLPAKADVAATAKAAARAIFFILLPHKSQNTMY